MCEKQDNDEYEFFQKRDNLEGLELIPTYLKISQILLLQYDDFIKLINQFNQTLKSFTKDEPYYIEFSIIPESDTTMLWKLFIRIVCSRISTIDKSVSETMILSLNQFLSMYQSLTQQLLTLETNSCNNLQNSTTIQEQYFSIANLSFPAFDTNECCICMDHQSNLVLPCTHKICDDCFKRWSDETSVSGYQTCPICRSDINIDDGFTLIEIPKSDNVKKALIESILSLPKDCKDNK